MDAEALARFRKICGMLGSEHVGEVQNAARLATSGGNSAPLPKDHPMLVAWQQYQQSEAYANTLKWAGYAEHRVGSLWAAFATGWLASEGKQVALGSPLAIFEKAKD